MKEFIKRLIGNLALRFLIKHGQLEIESDEPDEKEQEDVDYVVSAYAELLEKNRGEMFPAPLQYINLDKLFSEMHEAGYKAYNTERQEIFHESEFEDFGELAEPLAEFSNIAYRLIIKVAMEKLEREEQVELSVDENGPHYIAKTEDQSVLRAVNLARIFQ